MAAVPKAAAAVRKGLPVPGDVLAGLALAGMLLPEAVAYAAIAGVPPIHALVAALAGLCIYPLLGSSRFAAVAPTSSAAAIFASMVAANGLAAGYALVGLTGGLFLLATLLRADFLAAFISRPVLRGFAWALALTIVIKQLPDMTGIQVHARQTWQVLVQWVQHWPQAHLPSVLAGVAALLLWLALQALRRRFGWLQPSLLVLLLGVLASVLLHLQQQGVAVVGLIDVAGLRPQLPLVSADIWLRAAQLAPALLLILFAESWGAVRSLALQNGDTVHSRREMLALGAGNVASSLLQGLPVGAGFSASSANQAAGGRSKWSGVCAALAIAAAMWGLRDWLALLPVPVLAAVVAGILLHKLTPRPLFASLRMGGDAWLALVAAAGVIAAGVLFGMLLAVGLSVLLALKRFADPLWSELGQLPDSRDYVDLAHHPEAQRAPGVVVMRPEEPLFFANAENMLHPATQLAQAPGVASVVLSLEVSDELDTTAVEALEELRTALHLRGQHLLLARVKDRPRAALQRAAIAHEQGDAASTWRMYWSVDDAVRAAKELGAMPVAVALQ